MNDKKKPSDSRTETDETHARRDRRRKLLTGGGTVLGAAAFPKEWTRPVFETVVLPAHAQTSGSVIGGQLPLTQGDAGDWLDYLVPKAHAAPHIAVLLGGCVILAFSGTVVEATLLKTSGPDISKSGSHDPETGKFSVKNIDGLFDVKGTSSGGAAPANASGKVEDPGGFQLSFNASTGGAACAPLSTTSTPPPGTSTTTSTPPPPTSTPTPS